MKHLPSDMNMWTLIMGKEKRSTKVMVGGLHVKMVQFNFF